MLVVAAGYVIFGISHARGPRIKQALLDLRSLVWILPWFIGLAVISYFGQYGGTKLIPDWVDLIRQLRYGQSGELAVLDASAEVVAVNWTARVGPAVFVSEMDRVISLDDNMRVILLVSPDPVIQETTMSGLCHMMLVDKTFDTACEFVRLDLSTTQSAFWELLPDNDLTIVGFGEDTGTFTEEAVGLVVRLLAATATPAINFDEVLSSLRTLAQQYTSTNREHPYGRGAPA
jgi:hypothetical protein